VTVYVCYVNVDVCAHACECVHVDLRSPLYKDSEKTVFYQNYSSAHLMHVLGNDLVSCVFGLCVCLCMCVCVCVCVRVCVYVCVLHSTSQKMKETWPSQEPI